MAPKAPRSTLLSAEQEAVCVAFRGDALLRLDDGLYALQHAIPQLTGQACTGCISATESPAYVDIAEVRTVKGKLHLFVAIDPTSKLACVRLQERAARATACQLLRDLIAAVPYKIHTVLTENGVQCCHPPRHRNGPTQRYTGHVSDHICAAYGIEHRLTKPTIHERTARSNA